MGYNSGKIKVQSSAKKKTKNSPWNKDMLKGSSMEDTVPYFVGQSALQGKGLMAGRSLSPGELIGVSHINGQPNGDIGKYYNHSDQPNSRSILQGNTRIITPLRQLRYGEEITVDYRQQPELEQPESFTSNQRPMMQAGGTTYGTPQYNQAYNRGTVTRYNPETDVYQAPNLPEFTITENDPRVLNAIRDSRGNFINTAVESMSQPQKQMVEWMTGRQQFPSEALNIENPVGAFALDAVTDPLNLIGAGAANRALKLSSGLKGLKGLKGSPNRIPSAIKNSRGASNQFEKELVEAERAIGKENLANSSLKKALDRKNLNKSFDYYLNQDLREAELLGKNIEDIIRERTGMSPDEYKKLMGKTDQDVWDEVVGTQYQPSRQTLLGSFREQPVFDLQSQLIPTSGFSREAMLKSIKTPFNKLDYSKELPINEPSFLKSMAFMYGDSPFQQLSKLNYNDAVRRRAFEAQGNEHLMQQIGNAGRNNEGLSNLLNEQFWLRENKFGGTALPSYQFAGQTQDPYFTNLETQHKQQSALDVERERVGQIRSQFIPNAIQMANMEKPEMALKPNLRNWFDQNTAAYACNTYSCQAMRDAGATTATDLDFQGKTIPAGSPLPVIPGNAQFDALSSKLGFQLMPPGTEPTQEGDLIRGNYSKTGEQHSLLSTGATDDKGNYRTYNSPGEHFIYKARKPGTKHTRPQNFNERSPDRVMRYVGNIPQYTHQLEDTQTQGRSLSPQKIASKQAPLNISTSNPQLAQRPYAGLPETKHKISKREAKQYSKQLLEQMNKRKTPPGYHVMPNGSIMADTEMRTGGEPCYECGGGVHYQAGGNTPPSKAPQNSTIDSVGQGRTDLMKNFLTANIYKSMLDKQAAELEQSMGYFQGGGDTGSFYNPDTAMMKQYQGAINNQQKQFNKDWKAFGSAAMETAQNWQPQQQPQQQQPQQQQPQAVQQPFAATSMDVIPNQGFGSNQPNNFGNNTDQSFGQGNPTNYGFQKGGNITPEQYLEQRAAQPFNPDVPNPYMTPGRVAHYKAENPNIPMWGEMEGSNDPSTGYWDRVGNDWSNRWLIGGSEEEQMYTDPRMVKSLQDLIPGVGEQMSAGEYLQNMFLMPQKGANKMLTGYYETPSETARRYGPSMGWKGTALDIASDPMMYPELPAMAGKGAYNVAAKYGPKAAKEVAKVATKATKAATKYTKQAGEWIVKNLPNIDPAKAAMYASLIGGRSSQALAHTGQGPSDEDMAAMMNEFMNTQQPANMQVAPQTMPTSTIQQRQAPTPSQLTPQVNPYDNLSMEELRAITGVRKYGGDAIPQYQVGGNNVPIMQQPYYSPEQRAQASIAQGKARADEWINPSNFFVVTPVQQPVQDPTAQATIQLTEKELADSRKGRGSAPEKKATKSTKEAIAEVEKELETVGEEVPTKKRKGNITDEEKIMAEDVSSTTDSTYDTIGEGYGGYGRRKTKVWSVDPETGKRKLVFKDKYSGQGAGRGFDHRNNSRKNIYNIDVYGNIIPPANNAPASNEVANTSITQPVFSEEERPYIMPDQIPAKTRNGVSYSGQPLENQLPPSDYTFQQGGASFSDRQPVKDYQSYFYANGGGYDPNDPTGMLQTPESGQWAGVPEIGTDAYAQTQMPQESYQVKDKFSQGNANQFIPMALPALDMVSSMFEAKDARKNEAQLQQMKSASNVFSVNDQTDRGKNTVNAGYFDPSNMVPTQFQGNNQGAPGSPDTFAQYGGEQSNEQYLTEEEIQRIMAMGGQIEYI